VTDRPLLVVPSISLDQRQVDKTEAVYRESSRPHPRVPFAELAGPGLAGLMMVAVEVEDLADDVDGAERLTRRRRIAFWQRCHGFHRVPPEPGDPTCERHDRPQRLRRRPSTPSTCHTRR
jgi:hypothetical protein